MPNWIVCAHGSKVPAPSRNNFVIPPGVEIVFYVPHDRILDWDRSIMIWARLRTGDEGGAVRDFAYRTYSAYEMVPNYTAWGSNDAFSGIYRINGGKESLRAGQSGTIYDIVYGNAAAGVNRHRGRIHWVACTEYE